MALDAAEQAQIRTLAEEMDKFRRIVHGVPPNQEGLQRAVTRIDRQTQRLLRLVDGDPEIEHPGLRAQLGSIKGSIDRLEGQLEEMVKAKEAEANQRQGMMRALQVASTLLGSSLLLQAAQLLGVIQP